MIEIAVSDIVYREDLYPRIKSDPVLIQQYADNLDVLPPIEINQHNILIDGYHRWTAHRKVEAATIKATVTKTKSEAELLGLAIKRNAKHGFQLSSRDKEELARRLYAAKSHDREALKKLLSVSDGTLSSWLSDLDKAEKKKRQEKILDMWLACRTIDEIEAQVSLDRSEVAKEIQALCGENSELKKNHKVTFSEDSFTLPLYNVWTFAKKTNEVSHYGNSEQRIVDNLLYLYTEPFDIVIDPFAGGGSTIDICKKRMRRYWVSDRKPIVERENEIRKLDIAAKLPSLIGRWGDVGLVYLDPPYWKQAENKYSEDAEDLANMPLDKFTKTLTGAINRFAVQLSDKPKRAAIALLMQPTQWKAENRTFTDHVIGVIDGVSKKRLILENRVSCPYSTEQYNPQQVEWAKANKKLLVLSRELIIWRIIK